MRNTLFGLVVFGALAAGTAAHAQPRLDGQALIQPVYWNGDYCGPRCQEHRWHERERWEARREWRHHRQWEERRYGYGYNPYNRY